MSKVWNIYSKNTHVSGTPKYVAENLEYHDIWMGEEYVSVTIVSPKSPNPNCAKPFFLEIGDYIIYRGRTYSIYNVPSALKQARVQTYGEAFKYENVKFSSRAMELTEIRFLDIVLGDNQLHYTSLPTFSAYCETVDDLVDRLQANADRVKDDYDYWFFITPSKQRTLQRIIKWDPTANNNNGAWVPDTERRAVAEVLWNEYFSVDADVADEKKNVNIQVDKVSIWEGLSHVKQYFGLNFITNVNTYGRNVVIGAAAKHTENTFTYGKGNGLHQIERIADADQLIVTKLYAYGSDKNLPYHYYNDINIRPYLKVTGDYRSGSTETGISVTLENLQDVNAAFTNEILNSGNIVWYSFTCKIGNIEFDANIESVNNNSVRLLIFATGSNPGTTANVRYTSQANIDAIKEILENARIYGESVDVLFLSDVDVKQFPSNRHIALTDGMPDNMSVNCLMLPGFPVYALNDVVKCEYIGYEGEILIDETRFYVRNNPDEAYSQTPSFIIHGNHAFTFSEDRLRPWIKSPNAAELGIKEGDVHFTEENDDNGLEEVHPSIEGMTEDDVFHNGSTERLDEIFYSDVITDNGVFAEGVTIQNFKVRLKNLGFDLAQAYADAGSNMQLCMRDGYCGGRNFNVKGVTSIIDTTVGSSTYGSIIGWELTVERLPDDSLELYFPYSDKAAHGETPVANEAYQIRGKLTNGNEVVYAGDHFVLTDILIQDTNYIQAASVELFRKSCIWLAANDYTRFTYLPKIDEIFMARDKDTAYRAEYDTIKAGKAMDFEDEDLQISGSLYIDQLTIKENGNQDVPTFDVTLREDKQVGKLDRMQNQINSLTYVVGGGTDSSQLSREIQKWVKERFLSKINNDTAAGTITFQKGIHALIESVFYGIVNIGNILTDNIQSDTADIPQFTTQTTFQQRLKALGDAIFSENAQSDGFTSGMATGRGWQIDKYGNGEMESLKIRSYLEVIELLINRLQAQEGDTMFSDNDQIEAVEEREDETDHSISYILTLKEKWDGYFTSQMYGNILKGIINTLAAKEAGVSDETSTSVEVDGANKYYTSWMRVVATHNTDNTLDINQIRVVLYGDNDVPAQRNFAPCNMMAIARCGCIDYSSSDASQYAAEGLSTEQAIAASIKKRQTVFYLSSNEGRIVKMTGVNKPILEEGNYGMVFGNIPDFIRSWDSWQRLVEEHPHLNDRDYLYAQGLIYEDLVHVDITGAPVPIDVDCGDWVKGDAQGVTPSIGHGIYFNVGWNDTNKQFERHRVRHNNGIWLCLQNQPVVINGVATYYEPKFGSLYWKLVDGNGNYSIEFASTMGDAFYVGHVATTITPHLFFGNVDISADIAIQYWSWKRQTESGETAADIIWNNNHTQTRVLSLTDDDMPTAWSRNNKAIFTCVVVVNDGNSQVIIQNQVIA